MGWDIKAAANETGQGLVQLPVLSSDVSLPPWAMDVVVVFAVVAGLYWLLRPTLARAWKTIDETILSNWRLALLAATGLVLSLASGWTTWDGMKNFTNEPLLSFMITFGIQGVMLIIAWLIGESFATGMSQLAARPEGTAGRRAQMILGPVVGIFFFLCLSVLMLQWTGVDLRSSGDDGISLSRFSDQLIVLVAGLLAVALVFLYAAGDVIRPYLQSSRVVAKNAVLWVMFLACMATSVFFSFDSLFSAIFPQSERVRAAELRAQNQVAGIIADIDQTITSRHQTAVEDLFAHEGWQTYDNQLAKLAKAAKESEGEVEQYFIDQAEDRNLAVKEQQERIVSAQSGQAGLSGKKTSLADELARLKTERPTLAAEYAEKKNALDQRAKEIDSKRVEAMAEQKGVEGTGKVGRGPEYRSRMAELGKLQDYYKVGEQRVTDAKKRLDAAETRIAQIERELAQVDGDLAKLKADEATASQRIQMTESVSETSEGDVIDPARMLPAFEKARVAFRQAPASDKLTDVQKVCSQILGAMLTATPATKEKVKGLDCDPKQASESASVIFALNTGAQAFAQNCAGGDRLAQNQSADALFGFAKSCLADSGLPSKETDALRTNINFIELNRDDKAHRFVVTWNAFNDGNRLAYLALGIAIAIDLLVFMSGLFGANAVRSPLSDVPTVKARSAQQLEAIIENALLPDKYENARLALQAMRPITNEKGFMAEVRADRLDPHTAERVIGVLNAGATIHAVAYDEHAERYLVRSELFEFLSVVARKAFEESDHHVNQAELEKMIGVALLPDLRANSDTVLHYLHPITEIEGFTAEIKLTEITVEEHIRTVRNVLNAGATLDRVQRVANDPTHYWVHKDLYRTLARIRARALFDGSGRPRLEHAGAQSEYRGKIAGQPPPLPNEQPMKSIAAPAPPAKVEAHTAQHDQLHSDAALQAPLSPQKRAKLVEEYRRYFLHQLNLPARTLIAQMSNDDIREVANDAWHALERHGRKNVVLAELLRQAQKNHRDEIEIAYRDLRSHFSDDPQRVDLIDAVRNEILVAQAVLLLAPELGLMTKLLSDLEDAAGRDDGQMPGEQQLRDKLTETLQSVERVLNGLDLEDADSWRQVHHLLLEDDDEDVQNVSSPYGKSSDPRYN